MVDTTRRHQVTSVRNEVCRRTKGCSPEYRQEVLDSVLPRVTAGNYRNILDTLRSTPPEQFAKAEADEVGADLFMSFAAGLP